MKKRIALLKADGYCHPDGDHLECWCRREKVFGRIELLTAFFDGPPFWFVRLRNRSEKDAAILKERIGLQWFGNGHWRFVERERADAKFAQLCAIPEYAAEGEKAQKLRAEKKERMLTMISTGKMKSFRKMPPTGE